jgi:hypothetical protein
MTAAEDLACRYLALWQDYVTALLTELTMPEAVQHWAARGAERLGDSGPGDQSARGQLPAAEPAAGTATAASPSGERGDAVADLVRRLARIEKRVAALERGRRSAARARGRDRGVRRQSPYTGRSTSRLGVAPRLI